MNIKNFPPVGTRSLEKTVDSQEANSTTANAKNTKIASKDVFDQARSSTIDQLIAKSNAHDPLKQEAQQLQDLKEKQLEPTGSCDPMTNGIAKKRLEP
ncbi:hypothetical protein L0244_39805, partial [bacterium]|nr:hypothetical protein [bacterium]